MAGIVRVLIKALVAAGAVVGLAAALSCVDSGGKRSTGVMPTCAISPPAPYTGSASIPSADTAPAGPYAWQNVAIHGGGFVSGIIMSPVMPGLAFARTDVGGAYRFDPANERWWPLTDWVGRANSNLIGIESIAADPVDPNRVYLAAGEYLTAGAGASAILSSTDMGRTWTTNSIPAAMGGNVDGRSMGERLAIDPNLPSTLYFGSRNSGLWQSTDSAATWTAVASFPTIGATGGGAGSGSASGSGYGLTFVLFDPKSGTPGSPTPAIYVGVGVTSGTALYRSADAGTTWTAVAGQPSGVMPHHAVLDGCGNVFFTFNNGSGPNGVTAGAVWRYTPATGAWTDVSPTHGAFGFGGISADAAQPGTLLVTTIDDWSPGEIYRTTNGGQSWVPLVKGSAWDVATAQWLYWHTTGLPAMGWMGDVEIDPFDSSHALFITGQGLWSSADVTMADSGVPTSWTFQDGGLEETVVLDLASPPVGAPLLSGVGDIGGFRHDDLAVSPPEGMFGDPIFGNTQSLDFAEAAPDVVARVGTNSGSSGQNGAFSTDGGRTWTPFAGAPSGSTGSGSIAVSADGTTFVWAPKKGTPSYATSAAPPMPADGASWNPSVGISAGALVAADRVNSHKFYASSHGAMYASTDGGQTFVPATSPSSGRPRPVFGVEGDVWIATSAALLRSQDSGSTYTAVTGMNGAPTVNGATAVGFGPAVAAGASYPAVYLAGSVGGVWGTYRSDDAGMTWQRIDDPQHQFGYINILAGDRRQPGRVYLGTSGRGIVYGDPQTSVTQ